jgi:hypothetical protein
LLVEELESGLEILAGPLVDIEHTGKNIDAHILLVLPKIKDESSFCVVENLTPIKFNISNKCFVGPISQNNLVLISCPGVKKIVSREILDNCFKNNQGFLCHNELLSTVSEVDWLGFPCSPVNLREIWGQPRTNCNRRFLNGFQSRIICLTTYQKS